MPPLFDPKLAYPRDEMGCYIEFTGEVVGVSGDPDSDFYSAEVFIASRNETGRGYSRRPAPSVGDVATLRVYDSGGGWYPDDKIVGWRKLSKYTSEGVHASVDADRTRLFATYTSGRPANWSCDLRTKDLVCIAAWLDEELTRIGIDDLGRRTQTSQFNRRARSEEDLWAVAAEIMNDARVDNIDRNRKPHRRWG